MSDDITKRKFVIVWTPIDENWMGKINGKWMVASITIMSYDK
ncbi:hypothetical protein [Brevibacillus sp. SKDU10]|nr:hypothetical protein [Brevibacillus sp. SKDU10]